MTTPELLESLDRHFLAGCGYLDSPQLRHHLATGSCPECRARAQVAAAARTVPEPAAASLLTTPVPPEGIPDQARGDGLGTLLRELMRDPFWGHWLPSHQAPVERAFRKALDAASRTIRADERERNRQLAIDRCATYRTTDDADPSPFAEEFADLLGEPGA